MVSRTERENYSKRKDSLYSLTHYETTVVSGSFNSTTKSLMQRIRNCFVNTYNNNQNKLPKWVILMLENDMIRTVRYLEYTEEQLKIIFEKMIEWIFKELKNLRESIRFNMPFKTKKNGWPYFLWIEPTLHKIYGDNGVRKLFNAVLHKVNNENDDFIVVNLQGWDENDASLFLERERRYSITGLKTLWNAVDRAIMYADGKMLRNHGKTLQEVFKQNNQKNEENTLHEQKAHSSHRWNNNNRRFDRFRDTRAYEAQKMKPTFTHTPHGMRLPPPDRY